MSEVYEEIIEGESVLRMAPAERHERICTFLHERVGTSIGRLSTSRILERRSIVQLAPGTMVRPDLALVTVATGKLWLAVEIVHSGDHRPDTVVKKGLYEEARLPRLWMVDPRYDNVEIYHGTPYGLALKKILAGRETIGESLLPEFQLTVTELFAM
jgi:Uma2 family endonuclease